MKVFIAKPTSKGSNIFHVKGRNLPLNYTNDYSHTHNKLTSECVYVYMCV